MAPSLRFDQRLLIKKYMEKISSHCREDRLDHLWTQMLRHYFPLNDEYGIEREAYAAERGLGRVDLLVTTLRRNEIYKVLFLEAKRAPDENTEITVREWRSALRQLQENIDKWKGRLLTLPVFGILAIGLSVRCYVIDKGKIALTPYGDMEESLSLTTDAHQVHDIMCNIATYITALME